MNKALSTITKQTMSSLEIVKIINDLREECQAELLHKSFLSKVMKVLGEERAKNFAGQYKAGNGQMQPCYYLPKRESELMVMSESYKVQAAVYDRMTELEEKKVDPMKALNDPAVMRGLLLGYTERVLELESEVVELKPKAEALERIAISSDGSYCIRDTAKIMQLQEKLFIAWLLEHEWVYRRTGQSGLIAYAPILKKGYMEHKITTGDKTDGSGEQWSKTQARITSKGLVRLVLLIGPEMDEAA